MNNLYDIELIRVIDGDTIIANVQLGYNVLLTHQNIRLHGINAPEIYGTNKLIGLLSKQYLANLLKGKTLKLEPFQRNYDKYGRILATIYYSINHTDLINCNEMMLNSNHASRAIYVRGKYVTPVIML